MQGLFGYILQGANIRAHVMRIIISSLSPLLDTTFHSLTHGPELEEKNASYSPAY